MALKSQKLSFIIQFFNIQRRKLFKEFLKFSSVFLAIELNSLLMMSRTCRYSIVYLYIRSLQKFDTGVYFGADF